MRGSSESHFVLCVPIYTNDKKHGQGEISVFSAEFHGMANAQVAAVYRKFVFFAMLAPSEEEK
ncbi:MAG: hypothetical protein RXR20_31260 [Paraburkholderia sp.]|jgi:hypothetical protein|uniref:hypothetical protein n=1 Tax=Burkholderiaceae TaxID=119060 RepID=UPI0010FA4402|nr:hypothetical protein [Burkholderia sp. 4M9327F10]